MKDLKIEIELQALITEREGMVASNKFREDSCQALAYGEGAFDELADKIRALAEQIPKLNCLPGKIELHLPKTLQCSLCNQVVVITSGTKTTEGDICGTRTSETGYPCPGILRKG